MSHILLLHAICKFAQFAKCSRQFAKVTVQVMARVRVGLRLGSGLGQKCANCAWTISQLLSAFWIICKLRRLTDCLHFSMFIHKSKV